MTPEQFIDKWRNSTLTERSASHSHFNDLCDLLEVPKPSDADRSGKKYTFEKAVKKPDGRSGSADVWKKGCFAWEYKGDKKSLVRAYSQLKEYADALENPPLLIVSDMKEIRVHTNFTNAVAHIYVINLPELRSPENIKLLRWAFTEPERLRPTKTREAVTADAARALGTLAQKLRDKYEPRRVAHFLNKIVFSLFVEDIGLLPDRIFAEIIEEGLDRPDEFTDMLRELFRAMQNDRGRFGTTAIPWFNGGLFDDDDVLPLGFLEIRDLAAAARLDWAAIEPSIFGTLFEYGLDPDRRKEMASLFDAVPESPSATLALPLAHQPDRGVGIHYTDPATIMKIIEPVVLRPLRAEWEEVRAGFKLLKAKEREKRYLAFRKRLGGVHVLDPACGSGNFLYLALWYLKALEHEVAREAERMGLPPDKQRIGPQSVLGIEINPYAAELARVTIWIGEIQWQIRNDLKVTRRPILDALDGTACRDAIMSTDSWEASWPDAEFIIGNPPFLGNKKMIGALGESYVKRLRHAFEDRVPGSANLVCYWFEKARAMIESGRSRRAGLVSTSSIRAGTNRVVLERISKHAVLFEAWSDQPWVVDGAAVRVSLIAFCGADSADAHNAMLDGVRVGKIAADLTASASPEERVGRSSPARLSENKGRVFQGPVLIGPFDITYDMARAWLTAPRNPNGRSNADVLRPLLNGRELTSRGRERWVVDFARMTESDAALYELPFEYVRRYVKPIRDKNRRPARRANWWLHGETVPGLRALLGQLKRFIATPRVAKHRVFVWMHSSVLPDTRVVAIGRDDDVSFGILHSKYHEIWTLATCSWHGVGNDPTYNPQSVFETFPFPEGLTPNRPAKSFENDSRAVRIAEVAKRLSELRDNWLNPSDLIQREPEVVPGFPDRLISRGPKAEKELKKRTLTNLYNARPTWLADTHRELDEAVAAAYGWPADISDDGGLARLVKLNQERASKSAS